ncbi:MAG: SRPBCC family protein [Flavobacteriales bacterium]|nr:SRPBCC family protein [Flavobacteriales bacterium]
MGVITIIRRVRIGSSKEKVWNAIADIGAVERLHPYIVLSRVTSTKESGIGATRHLHCSHYGIELKERVVTWKENDLLKLAMYESRNLPMRAEMISSFALTEEGDATLLTGTLRYASANWVGGLWDRLVLDRLHLSGWTKFMAGIKHYVETGEPVDQRTRLDLGAELIDLGSGS